MIFGGFSAFRMQKITQVSQKMFSLSCKTLIAYKKCSTDQEDGFYKSHMVKCLPTASFIGGSDNVTALDDRCGGFYWGGDWRQTPKQLTRSISDT